MEALGINLGYLIVQALAFLILVLALKGWLYQPVLNVLAERQARIAKGLEDARQASVARENADVEARKILDEARAEAARLRQEASGQAEEQARAIVNQANAEAQARLQEATEEAVEERNRVLADMRDQVATIAIAAARKLVNEALDEQRQRRLIGDFLTGAPDGLTRLKGEQAVVTSALPLTEAEKTQIRGALNVSTVDFRVDPAIIGGLIVRVGDQVLDNSIASRMGAMEEALAR